MGVPFAEPPQSREGWSLQLFFLCTFGLTQKYQKVKHGEKPRVSSPSLAERARKTALFAAQKDAPLRLWRLGKVRKRPLRSPAAVVCTSAPGARAVVATSSALFAVRSCRPKACEKDGFRRKARIGYLRDCAILCLVFLGRPLACISPRCENVGRRSRRTPSARNDRAKQRSLS